MTKDREVEKTQAIRIADVFFIGPLMVWGGLAVRDQAKTLTAQSAGMTLAVLGVATVLYNGRNYLEQRDRRAS